MPLFRTEGKPFRATRSNLRKKFPIARLAGIEWEHNDDLLDASNRYRNWTALRKWSKRWRGGIHEDGSCGLESVTPPLAGDYISKCLTSLGSALKSDKAEMDSDCSVHVHVDTYDFSWEDMYRLLWVYSQVEDQLFILGGKQRRHSHWCRPCGADYYAAVKSRFTPSSLKNPDIRGKVLNVAYGFNGKAYYDVPNGHVGKRHGGRYRALNLCPWLWAKKNKYTQKGTVEFRLHQNTNDTKRVIGWTHLLVQLVDWVRKATDEEAKQLPDDGWKILYKIAPKSKLWIIKQRAAR